MGGEAMEAHNLSDVEEYSRQRRGISGKYIRKCPSAKLV